MNEALITSLSKSLRLKEEHIKNVLEMLNEGNTVPFISRYRKELTGNMDETEIKAIDDEYRYLENVDKRKREVIRLIEEQGMLTDELRTEILKQTKLTRIEDLYRPYKQKKKTRATEAKRKGLEPLADIMYCQKVKDLALEAERFVNDEVETTDAAIRGAQDIIAENISDVATYRSYILKVYTEDGEIISDRKKGSDDAEGVFEMYYAYKERVKTIVPHRVLALNRGEKLGILNVKVAMDVDRLVRYISNQEVIENSTTENHMKEAIEDSLKRLIMPSIEREIRKDLSDASEVHAVHIFKENLAKLLLTPPLKGKTILGVDPAFRTGCKLAVVNRDGGFLYKDVMYPHPPKTQIDTSRALVIKLLKRYDVELIAIGNGTASRETEQFIADVLKAEQLEIPFIIVNEAGASVYSASDIAREEFPDFNVEERSAVSIARRVQDPLSELVKIDPKSIGVGQYQHDINQKFLSESLDFVVDTTVNQVGVDVNTASSVLLSHVSGLTPLISKQIVNYRNANGWIKSRNDIYNVPRLGAKTFEQCIGFLRVFDGEEPLDVTEIHPEKYPETYQLLSTINMDISEIGPEAGAEKLAKIDVECMARTLNIGVPTLTDIIKSLTSPQRDIRDDFETPLLKSDVLKLEDITAGMKLSGTVRNVTDFGAFVDIGVKNDGLVHVSKLSKRFVKNPMDVVSVGDIVDVTVIDVDLKKGRVSLSMKD